MAIITAVDPEIHRVIGDRMKVLVEGSATGNGFELFDFEGDLGSGPPPHAHPWAESIVVLEGEIVVECGAERAVAVAGTTAVFPAGSVHRFEISSPRARFLVATTGDRASKFFTDLSANAPDAPTAETLPRIVEIAKRNGLTSPLF